MGTIDIDYYTGFEGESEIVFSSQHSKILIWEGYFDEIMQAIPTNPNGKWEGFVLIYHLNEGWYENVEYLIDDLDELIEQLSSVDTDKLTNISSEIHSKLLNFLKTASNVNEVIRIEYL